MTEKSELIYILMLGFIREWGYGFYPNNRNYI